MKEESELYSVERFEIPLVEYGVGTLWSEKYEESYSIDRTNIIARLRCRLLTTKSEPFEYFDNWWDAFKDRWFPKWALKRWPARKKTEFRNTWICPHIAAPEQKDHIDFLGYGLKDYHK